MSENITVHKDDATATIDLSGHHGWTVEDWKRLRSMIDALIHDRQELEQTE